MKYRDPVIKAIKAGARASKRQTMVRHRRHRNCLRLDTHLFPS